VLELTARDRSGQAALVGAAGVGEASLPELIAAATLLSSGPPSVRWADVAWPGASTGRVRLALVVVPSLVARITTAAVRPTTAIIAMMSSARSCRVRAKYDRGVLCGNCLLALFVLRRAQGRLAHLYGELGRERDARAVFDSLMSRDLAREHLDAERLFSISLLPDPCASLRDEDAAATLYSLLLPYERLHVQAPVEAIFGSLARGLGILATTLRRFDDAERHFDAALETERKMRARPWLARVQHDHGAMLVARGNAGDAARATTLCADAGERLPRPRHGNLGHPRRGSGQRLGSRCNSASRRNFMAAVGFVVTLIG
jgi:hypothetical protein